MDLYIDDRAENTATDRSEREGSFPGCWCGKSPEEHRKIRGGAPLGHWYGSKVMVGDSQAGEMRYPDPKPKHLLPHKIQDGMWKQQRVDKPPLRALTIKGNQLREAMRGGNPLDWVDIHERFVDLWQEARLTIWRAKRKKAGLQDIDPLTGKTVQMYIPDDGLVLQAIDVTRKVLEGIMKLRREMGAEKSGIPRWAIERIERGLRNYPEAQHALLKELASENDEDLKKAEKVEADGESEQG